MREFLELGSSSLNDSLLVLNAKVLIMTIKQEKEILSDFMF